MKPLATAAAHGSLHVLLLVCATLAGCSSLGSTVGKATPRAAQPAQRLSQGNSDAAPVRLAQHVEAADQAVAGPAAIPSPGPAMSAVPVPSADVQQQPATEHPIDLATAFRLAGANNLQIALALERVAEAQARYNGARAMWVPSVRGGVGYNRHTGRIQDTRGDIIEVRRSSVFAGGGAGVGVAPLNGGSGGPPRLFVDLSLTDALFEPLAACQVVRGASAGSEATFNNELFGVAMAYLEVVQAQQQHGIATEAVNHASDLLHQTQAQVKAGFVQPADEQRIRAELAFHQRAVLAAEERVATASAELARRLRLDPSVRLYSTEAHPAPLEIVPLAPLPALISQAHGTRPEVSQAAAFVGETCVRVNQEQWRPWIPHLYLGYTGGTFGGGPNDTVSNFSDRSDFDAVAAWELRNLGLGNRALRQEAASRHRQAHILVAQIRDRIAAEVTAAYHQVVSRGQQLEHARQRERAAEATLEQSRVTFKLNPGAVRPIEFQQAVRTLSSARNETLGAIIGYNQAQFALLRALGKPPK